MVNFNPVVFNEFYGAGNKPLVIAALLGFILAPLIRHLHSWHLWRVASVIATVLVAIAVIGALGSTIVFQVAQLAEDLPKYESNLRANIRSLGGGSLMSTSSEPPSRSERLLVATILQLISTCLRCSATSPLGIFVRS